MATTPNVNADPPPVPVDLGPISDVDHREELRARTLAERYHHESSTWTRLKIDQDLFGRSADLMLRYGFVPYRRTGKTLRSSSRIRPTCRCSTSSASPRHADQVVVGAAHRDRLILKKSEIAARAGRDRALLQLLKEGERRGQPHRRGLTSDISPVIRLVDSTIHTAIQRRERYPHRDGRRRVYVRRIDGVLQSAMRRSRSSSTARSSRASRSAELDIAEKRVPQDGCSAAHAGQDDRLPRLDRRRPRRGRGHPYSTRSRSASSSPSCASTPRP
jgi:type II secretory ATPase GspE/PulE/Tfp pilus assembly ATPase PilB-like protein